MARTNDYDNINNDNFLFFFSNSTNFTYSRICVAAMIPYYDYRDCAVRFLVFARPAISITIHSFGVLLLNIFFFFILFKPVFIPFSYVHVRNIRVVVFNRYRKTYKVPVPTFKFETFARKVFGSKLSCTRFACTVLKSYSRLNSDFFFFTVATLTFYS